MGKKRIEDRFSIDMDAYLKGKERLDKPQSEEYNELLELGRTLAVKDFSKGSNKQEIFCKTLKNINQYKGEDSVEKSKKTRSLVIKAASFAFVCILGISLMQTSLAQAVVDKIVRTVSLGHVTILQEEPSKIKSHPVPDELKGKIFAKDGKPLEVFSEDIHEKMYTANGEEIVYIDSNGEIITVAEKEKVRTEEISEEEYFVVKNPDELNQYTCFNVILPSYLPKGYKFNEAKFYKDKNGVVENTKYLGVYFTNEKTGKYIYMQQRFADEETAYATGADKVEEIKINGVDAILYDNSNLVWEVNGVIYTILGRGEITKGELIKMAESIK